MNSFVEKIIKSIPVEEREIICDKVESPKIYNRYEKGILTKLHEDKEYVSFLNENVSVHFSLYNPNMVDKVEDYFSLYSISEAILVKEGHLDWSEDEELLILGCVGQETYLFSFGKEIYAFPQHLDYEKENLVKIADNLDDLLFNKRTFSNAMKYSDMLESHFEEEDEYELFLQRR